MVNQQESILSNLDLVSFDNVNVNTAKSVKDLVADTYAKYSSLINSNTVVPVIDNSLQLDGKFFDFCRKNNIVLKTLTVDTITVLSSEDNCEPFLLQGAILVETENLQFIKNSLFYKASEDSNQVSSFVLLDPKKYDKYLEFKTKYNKYVKEIDGIEVKAIGGENYYLDANFNWDKLFLGEHQKVKEEVIQHIDTFKKSEKLYKDLDLPYKTCIFITGLPGNGKTELINTILCEYDLDPYTVTCDIDDSVLAAVFSYAAAKKNAVLFIEDVDQLISDNVIDEATIPVLLDSFDTINCKEGLIILISSVKLPESYKDITFKFDKVVDLSFPEYNCVSNLFGKFFSEEKLAKLTSECKKNNISYDFMITLYKLFAKSMLGVDVDKKNDGTYYENLQKILKYVIKENETVNNKYMKAPKSLGLGSRNKEKGKN